MRKTLNVTKNFNTVVNDSYFLNHYYSEMKPYIYFGFPPKIEDGILEFELMNFGLNMDYDGEIESALKENLPYFDDIVNCDFIDKNIMIFGKASFKITNVKGIEMRLWDLENGFHGKKRYYSTASYRLEKGDFLFDVGGYSEFSSYYTTLYVIADKDTQATFTFSSDEYILRNNRSPELEKYIASKQTFYDYKTSSRYYNVDEILKEFNTKMPKTFDFDFRQEYFCREHLPVESFGTDIATKSELVVEAEDRDEKVEKRGIISRIFKK